MPDRLPGPVTPALELRHCRALVAVADYGGPTRAAAALGVSQSTVSEALLALERVVGVPLLARGGRVARGRASTPGRDGAGVSAAGAVRAGTARAGTARAGATEAALTPAGVALLPHARTLLAAADAALAAARTAAGDALRPTALGAVESINTYVLPPVLAALRARWPRADVQVSTGLCHDLRASVAAGRLDLALVLEPATEPALGPDAAAAHGAAAHGAAAHAVAQGVATRGVATAVLGPARLALVATPAHAAVLAAEHPPTPAVLARAAFYASDPRGAYHAVLAAYFADHGVGAPRLRSVGSVDAVKRSVRGIDALGARDPGPDGLVLGVVSAHAVAEELRAGLLVEVRPAPAIAPVFLKAVLPRAVAPTPVVAALLTALHGVDLRSTDPPSAVLNPCS